MSIVTITSGASIGFTGTSCAEFGRAYTTWRWDNNGFRDGWSAVTCSVDLLPQSGTFTADLQNVDTAEIYNIGAVTISQMDSYSTYAPSGYLDSLLSMSAADAATLSGAILLAWSLAYGVRLIRKSLETDGATDPDS